MRFYLDNDVDQRCRRVLEEAGHECWATGQAGRPDAEDGDQAYYAVVKGAVLITHDQGFTAARKRNTIGKHVCLRCGQPNALALLKKYVDILPDLLSHHEHLVVELFPDDYRVTPGKWL